MSEGAAAVLGACTGGLATWSAASYASVCYAPGSWWLLGAIVGATGWMPGALLGACIGCRLHPDVRTRHT